MIGGGATGVGAAGDPLVWLCHAGDVPEPVVAVVAVVTFRFVVGVTTVWAFGGDAVAGPVVVADPDEGAVVVVSFVAVVFAPDGKTVTGCLDGDGTTAHERIRD